jgi:protein-tyrosine-phosphatase
MGKTSNAAKDAWNAIHYAQVKISADPSLAAAYKAVLAKESVSMAKDISEYMKKRIREKPSAACDKVRVLTRQERRKAVAILIERLEEIKSAEEAYMDRIPENLSGSKRYEDAETALSKMDDAIEALLEAYL